MMRDESTLPTVLRKKLPPNLEKIKYGHYTKKDTDYPIHIYLKENDIKVDETGSDVINFLRGKSILVTGATGFLGKLLVEKLLRCCGDIDTIYIIVRTKKGKDPETRVKEYLDNWVFVKLSEIYPNFRDKVVGISGDFEQDGIGLSEESRKILTQKVTIIYHVAATIRFDEKLKKAVQINVKGTKEIIKLAKECQKIDVFTYMGTSYSNCIHKKIEEKFYTPYMNPQDLIDLTDTLSSEVVDRITPGLLGECPNTYAFTKQIAEEIVRLEAIGMPACIQRPSIVISTVNEPVRNWVDNIYGPVGLIEAVGIGLCHTMLGNPTGKSDMIPADYAINNYIAASYKTAKEKHTNKVEIYNYTASDSNPLYWKNLRFTEDQAFKVGSKVILMLAFFRFTKYWNWFWFLTYILHTLPGHIVDFVAVRLGKEPQLTKAYAKINKFVVVLSYFTLNEWSFDSTNSRNLWNFLNEKDKKIFAFDLTTVDWQDYFDTYIVAIREFLIHEFLDNLEEGRTHQKRVYAAFYIFLSTVVALSVYFLINTIFCFIPLTIIIIILYYIVTSYE